MTADPYVLLKMSEEPDCHFVASWLLKAAEAQASWSEVLDKPDSARGLELLYADGIPDVAAAALELLGELEHHRHVVALDLYPDDGGLFCRELALLVQLGFFVRDGEGYQIAIPDQVSPEFVLAAAVELSSAVSDLEYGVDVLEPELKLATLSLREAMALRATLLAPRRTGVVVRLVPRLKDQS
ncbi:hypothetical protein [Bradyrhizobium sp. CCGE-LA001]|uniref:hypothetical protein n=1 Tax=Bradyrhizobium sp. CCGE-LA001 TaxID=1223566 RepID=UPI0002AA9DB6|nr:hypothetical protein [Bradyrhizobium sp. CCGE-LA001]